MLVLVAAGPLSLPVVLGLLYAGKYFNERDKRLKQETRDNEAEAAMEQALGRPSQRKTLLSDLAQAAREREDKRAQ